MSDINKKCPVCGQVQGSNKNSITCKQCGFEYAFIKYSASDKTFRVWQQNVQENKKRNSPDLETMEIFLSGDSLACMNYESKELYIFRDGEEVQHEQNVISYSLNDRNSAILYADGKLRMSGDNSYGQYEMEKFTDVKKVVCGPNSSYAIKNNGTVQISGLVLTHEIETWTDIENLVCGSYHILVLTKNHTVKIAGDNINPIIADKISKWKHVKAVCATTDASVALFEDGTVSFAGREKDLRADVEGWRDIVSIAIESAYTVGVTKNGQVRLAGFCKPFFDIMNRSTAAEWKNVTKITTGKSSIAALFQDGTVKIVGNFSGDIEEIYNNWKKNISYR